MMLLLGDNRDVLKNIPDNSVDSVVTDPPYGLKFMGKQWDYDVPTVELWREVFRVLKPGGHLLSFGGTRTYHRMAVNIEDAGFEIRDQIQWIYGSGFPKSQDISKAIDKQAGAEREVVGLGRQYADEGGAKDRRWEGGTTNQNVLLTAPATDAAKQWQGWGTALKPANEPICMARKPIEKGLTIAENVQKYGTGAINVDGGRIGTETIKVDHKIGNSNSLSYKDKNQSSPAFSHSTFHTGRWPANVLFDEDAAAVLGEPSRFFYVAKASKSERNAGLEGMPEKGSPKFDGGSFVRGENNKDAKDAKDANFHPTVKPIKLMQYLIKLVTPPGGTVLDPFMGSGSTGVAAKNLGFNFAGIELSPEYFEIAKRRIEHA